MSRERIESHGAVMSEASILQRLDSLTAAFVAMAKVAGTRLTRAEVLERLRVSPNTLTAYMRSRDFPTPGRDGKWLLAEIVDWEARK